METTIETSIFLARVIGLVSVISAAAVMARYKENLELEEEAVKSPLLAYLSGFLIMILGVVLVVTHQVWTLDWRGLITVLGWMVLFKGIGRIFFPNAVRRMIEQKKTNKKFILGEIAVLIIGLYLVYYGFFAY